MSSTKESELVTAVLLYAIRALAEGDQLALRGMGFGPKEIETLRTLHLADLYRAGSLQAHCLEVRLNRKVFWPMIEHLHREREAEEIQYALIAADAPLEMLRTLFGVGAREYTRLRRLLSVSAAVGRPPEPDEAMTHTLWAAWSQRLAGREPDALDAADYLAIHEETGASLRAVWNLAQRWACYGDLSDLSA